MERGRSVCTLLRARLNDGRRKRTEVVQLFSDDGLDDIQIQAGVLVNSHIAEANHPLHAGGEVGWKYFCRFQEGECVTTILWDTEFALTDHVHGQIDGRLASALKI